MVQPYRSGLQAMGQTRLSSMVTGPSLKKKRIGVKKVPARTLRHLVVALRNGLGKIAFIARQIRIEYE